MASLRKAANNLIQQLADGCTGAEGLGSMSCAIYDTAWLAMVSKPVDGEVRWLFPECFNFVLSAQTSDGAWPAYGSLVDGLLNTMAALLSMKWHLRMQHIVNCPLPADIESRISRGSTALRDQLQRWDVEASFHVGFEILVPALIRLLEEEELVLEFPQRQSLMMINRKKLENFQPEFLYGRSPTTLIHSLEAFTGQINFDKVAHRLWSGSMLASPSSTAAYLINASIWQDEAEEYLRRVIVSGEGRGTGGVPCAFPITIFETTWALSILLEAGYATDCFQVKDVQTISGFLESCLNNQQGVVGFAPGFIADADDTARTILTLYGLGKVSDPSQMIREFEADDHFRTYNGERNSSFSANCNVLIALLHSPDVSLYSAQISKAASYLCNNWDKGAIKDKWNLSPEYSCMLLAEAMVRLLQVWDEGKLVSLPYDLVANQIPKILSQVLIRTLRNQCAEGYWKSSKSNEVTSYAVLTISSILSLPWLAILKSQAAEALRMGQAFLQQNERRWSEAEYLWIEKVTYKSSVLAEAYCLAAMGVGTPSTAWSPKVQKLTMFLSAAVEKFDSFFGRLPLFSESDDRLVKHSLVEGYMFLPQLKQIRLDIFPRKGMAKDRYLEYIPFTWTGCNNLNGNSLSNRVIWDMMIISMLNYQADEYMEDVVAQLQEPGLEAVEKMVGRLCGVSMQQQATNGCHTRDATQSQDFDLQDEDKDDVILTTEANGGTPGSRLAKIETCLSRFINHVLEHPASLSAPSAIRSLLAFELCKFLLAHLAQIRDNFRFGAQAVPPTLSAPTFFSRPRTSYLEWVRTTSADHTSCPYSFVFFTCLIAPPGSSCFTGVEQHYFLQALYRHLATMCRQYNDYGSIERDRVEQNLNSVNFPEFAEAATEADGSTTSSDAPSDLPGGSVTSHADGNNSSEGNDNFPMRRIKESLLTIAAYERGCLNLTMEKLGKLLDKKTMRAIQTFVDVTDLYGQIYVARDIATRMK